MGQGFGKKDPTAAQQLALGAQHHQGGDLDRAERLYRQVLQAEPNHPEALHLLGMAAYQRGDLDTALDLLRQAITTDPTQAHLHNNLGILLQTSGQPEAAVSHFRQAIGLRPDYAEAHNNMGNALMTLERVEEASAYYQQAAAQQPNYVEAQANWGNALALLGRFDEAIDRYRWVLERQPSADVHGNLANALALAERWPEATVHYDQALSLDPGDAEILFNLGTALRAQNRLTEAAERYQQALRLQPNWAEAHALLGLTLLTLGDLAQGFAEWEWHWRPMWSRFSAPLWDGSDLSSGTILIWAEGDLADAIQMIRYAPLVAARCGWVVLECPPPLVRLFQSVPGIDQVVATGQPLPSFDAHAPLLRLPGVFRTSLATIPARIPYLSTLPIEIPQDGQLRVGIAWSQQEQSPPSELLEAAGIPGVTVYGLDGGSENSQFSDLADLAAAIAGMDLVVGVDGPAVHLAGALGKPTWTILPQNPGWRWLLSRNDSPWYPTMRLFRPNGDPLAELRQALIERVWPAAPT